MGRPPGKSNLMQEVVKFGNFCDEFSERAKTDNDPKGNEFGECVLRPGECRSASTGTASAANFHGMYSKYIVTQWRGVHLRGHAVDLQVLLADGRCRACLVPRGRAVEAGSTWTTRLSTG